jgi:hypothetical protein
MRPRGQRADHLRRHIEDRVAPLLARESEDHLPGLNNFARPRANRCDDARRIRFELGEADQVVGRFQLGFCRVDLGLCGLLRLLCLVVVRSRGPALV